MATVKRNETIKIKGKKPNKISEYRYPLKNAKKIPETHIPRDSRIIPIFSPNDFVMAWHSFDSLADISVTLISSNHAISYCNIARR